ncbi:unnamed protein product [Parascedosporium putredinis]|uniref:Sulfotransferase family protein n=1 Tax=Parascedosporium putredinis TaxID=1442378 RepID=A0A9P1GYK6_9PEZI|nr:unnamed protein product [Parascedosporium putredinis]CAI7991851.1 unnamed protein product [Parascedosporium putredinis]
MTDKPKGPPTPTPADILGRWGTLIAIALAILIGYFAMGSPDSPTGDLASIIDQKIFVIGLSKTGTTSLGDALAQLGYHRSGWEDIRSRWLFHAYTNGRVEALLRHTERFGAFEDIPWSLAYREMADAYPTAKFILSLRDSEEDWLSSIRAHTRRRSWNGHTTMYGCLRADDCPEKYLAKYRQHSEETVQFFSDRGELNRLLTFYIDSPREMANATDEDSRWAQLQAFLEVEDGDASRRGEFPHANSKLGFLNRDPFGLSKTIDQFVFNAETSFLEAAKAIGANLGWRIKG